MKKYVAAFAILVLVIIGIFSFIPDISYAQPLVPCGGPGQEQCQACDLTKLAQNVIQFIVKIAFVIAAIMFAVVGVMFFTGGSSPDTVKKAKQIFRNTFIGIIIVLTSWLIIDVILQTLAGKGVRPFTNIECVKKSSTSPSSGVRKEAEAVKVTGTDTQRKTGDVSGTSSDPGQDDTAGEGQEGPPPDVRKVDDSVPTGIEKSRIILDTRINLDNIDEKDTSGFRETLTAQEFDSGNTEDVQNYVSQCQAQGGIINTNCVLFGFDADTNTEICERTEYSCS